MRGYALVLCVVLAAAPAARAQDVPDGFVVETLVPGLAAPVAFEFLPGGRVLYAEQFTARVRLVRSTNTVQATPVISLTGVSTGGGERGLLGLAIDPGFPARPYLYLHYTVASPAHVHIARFTLTGDLNGTAGTDLVADPASRYDLIANAPDAASNHNGGTVRFGIEGVLYASFGEDAVPCAAQATTSLRGVIVRLRTDALPPGPGAAFRAQITPADNPFVASADSNTRLVAAYGLRNPFRFQVDAHTGTLTIADVGAGQREEVDLLGAPTVIPMEEVPTANVAPLGANFGWPWFEGTVAGSGCGGSPPAGLVAPAYDYDRTSQPGGAAIISAGLYRQVPGGANNWPNDHVGNLFANDYYSGVLRRVVESGGSWSVAAPIAGQPAAGWGTGFSEVSDWRIGPDGALWYCRQSSDFAPNSGSIGRIKGSGNLNAPHGPSLSLRLIRSPAVRSAELRVTASSGLTVRIVDLAGRSLRTLWDGGVLPVSSGNEFPLTWDGLTDRGESARPGMYLALVESGGRRAAVRIPFLR